MSPAIEILPLNKSFVDNQSNQVMQMALNRKPIFIPPLASPTTDFNDPFETLSEDQRKRDEDDDDCIQIGQLGKWENMYQPKRN